MTTTHFSANNARLYIEDTRGDLVGIFRDRETKYETRVTCPMTSEFVRQATGDGCRLGNVRLP